MTQFEPLNPRPKPAGPTRLYGRPAILAGNVLSLLIGLFIGLTWNNHDHGWRVAMGLTVIIGLTLARSLIQESFCLQIDERRHVDVEDEPTPD